MLNILCLFSLFTFSILVCLLTSIVYEAAEMMHGYLIFSNIEIIVYLIIILFLTMSW
jgi:hypothetical protein